METIDNSTLKTALTITMEAFAQTTQTQKDNTTYPPDAEDSPGWDSIVKIVPSLFMCTIGVLGNVAALIILHVRPSKDSRSTAFFHLVKALAVVDLTGIVALSPVTIFTHGQVVKAGGMELCAYFTFVILLAGNGTLSIVVVMAVERFMVTKFPFQYSKVMSHRNMNICIACAWLISALVSALPIMGVGRYSDRWPGTWCFFDFRDGSVGAYVVSILYAGVGILIVVVTFVLNASVVHHLWRMRKSRLTHSSVRSTMLKGTPSNKGPDSETRMVIFLLAIIIVFTVCYLPLMVRVLINQFQNVGGVELGGIDDKMDLWSLRLASFNQIIDPWIYIISRFTCCGRRRQNQDNGDYARSSPNKTTVSVVSNSPSPKRSLFVRKVNQAKSLFVRRPTATAADENGVTGNNCMMVPLNPESQSRFNTQIVTPPSSQASIDRGETDQKEKETRDRSSGGVNIACNGESTVDNRKVKIDNGRSQKDSVNVKINNSQHIIDKGKT